MEIIHLVKPIPIKLTQIDLYDRSFYVAYSNNRNKLPTNMNAQISQYL